MRFLRSVEEIVLKMVQEWSQGVNQFPTVSVVIPTRNRPNLVVRAVRSALDQVSCAVEVIVVVDGPDDVTVEALAATADSRVAVIALPRPVGGSEARNVGIRRSRGEFIALLDDDDEWSQHKLMRQLELARRSKAIFPVVTCRLIARRPICDEIWPIRPMKHGESMSEYLICREASIRQGEGFIQTSTLLVPRALMLEVPFKSDLSRHQDWDWLIRASVYPGVEFLWVWDPLVIYHIDQQRNSVSAGASLGASLNWVNANHLVTPKAKAYFYATQVAVRCRTIGTFSSVIANTLRFPRAFLIAMGLALIPRSLVYRLRPRSVLTHA
jgi:glycosyltransferase involved in cell wall biosynthesis